MPGEHDLQSELYKDIFGDPQPSSEMLHAFDTYRSHFISRTKYKLKPVLVTNGHLPPSVLEQCKNHDIEPIAEKALGELLERFPCTIPDIEFMEATRLESMKQFKDLFR